MKVPDGDVINYHFVETTDAREANGGDAAETDALRSNLRQRLSRRADVSTPAPLKTPSHLPKRIF